MILPAPLVVACGILLLRLPSASAQGAPADEGLRVFQAASRIIDAAYEPHRRPKAMRDMDANEMQAEILRIGWEQLKHQYTPTVSYNAYAGGFVESTGYSGFTLGGEFAVEAPLCNYLGADVASHAYHDGGAVLAYDAGVTACLPLGLFSLQLRFGEQRNVRLRMSSAPVLVAGQYDARGTTVKFGGYRWFASKWEAAVADLEGSSFRFTHDGPGISEQRALSGQIVLFKYLRYGQGFLGASRGLSFFVLTGNEQSLGASHEGSAARVSTVIPVELENYQFVNNWYFDIGVGYSNGLSPLWQFGGQEAKSNRELAFDVAARTGTKERQFVARASRGQLADGDLRLVRDERLDAAFTWKKPASETKISSHIALSEEVIGANRLANEDTQILARATTYGVASRHSRPLVGPFYIELQGSAARTFYPAIDGPRSLRPQFEARGLVSVVAGLSEN